MLVVFAKQMDCFLKHKTDPCIAETLVYTQVSKFHSLSLTNSIFVGDFQKF